MRLLSALVLSLLLVSLSAAQGLMRGSLETGQTALVICTGHGLETITLDLTGNPVAPRPDCPDTGLHALDTAPVAPATFVATLVGVRPKPIVRLAFIERTRARHEPRAPPVLL